MASLFRVRCRGMQDTHGTAYVVASDPTAAWEIVKGDLDKRDLGFSKDRELLSVELVAEDDTYPRCHRRLYVK